MRCAKADSRRKGTKIIKTRRLFVGSIPAGLPEDSVRSYFSQFGEISYFSLNKRADNNAVNPKQAFSIIEFKSEDVAQLVLDSRGDLNLDGSKLTCAPFKGEMLANF